MQRFIDASERGLAAGRARSLRRMLEDDDALAEMVPKQLAARLGRANTVRLGRFGVGRTLRKYGGHKFDDAAHEAVQIEVCELLRTALARSSPALFGAFSFADIAMTAPLVYLKPAAFGLRLGAASRERFADAALADRYLDLLRWRDAIYDAYRPRPVAKAS